MKLSRLAYLPVLALVSAALVPAPAAAAPTYVDAKDPAARALVELSVASSLGAAESLSGELDGEVIGYRYANGPLVGEFYPRDGFTADDFLAEFATKYGSAPRITGVVADFASQEAAAQAHLGTNGQRRSSFEPPAIDTGLLDAQLVESSPDGDTGREARRSDGPEWRANTVDASVVEAGERVLFSQASFWDGAWWGSSPVNIPEHYGVEFQFDAYNDLGTPGVWPFCFGQQTNFMAQLAGSSWSIYSAGNADSGVDLSDAQPWLDNPIADECSRQTFTVGLRYPQNLQPTEYGNYAVLTQVEAPRGDYETNRIAASHQLVDDQECRALETNPDGNAANLGFCMGYWQQQPEGIDNARTVLSGERGWHAPDRCWTSAYYGEWSAEPSPECGPALPGTAIAVTDLAAEPSFEYGVNSGWDLTLVHEAGAEIDPDSAPYAEFLPGLDPSQPGNNTHIDEVSDVRVWSRGVETPIESSDAWEFEHDIDAGSISLRIPTLDLDRETVREFLENGWVSFRIGWNGDQNWLRVTNLDHYLPPDANTYIDYDFDAPKPRATVWLHGEYVLDRGWLDAFRDEPYTVHYTTWVNPMTGRLEPDRVWAEQSVVLEDFALATTDGRSLPGLDPECPTGSGCASGPRTLWLTWDVEWDRQVLETWEARGELPGPHSLAANTAWSIDEVAFDFGLESNPWDATLGGRVSFTAPSGAGRVTLVPESYSVTISAS